MPRASSGWTRYHARVNAPTTTPEAAGNALAPREGGLPKLLTPRQVSLRAFGVVFGAEVVAMIAWALTGWTWLALGILFGAIVSWSFRRRGDLHRALAANERGRELLDLGRIDEATAQLDALLSSRRTPPNVRPFAAYYRALVALRRGEFGEARARLAAVIHSGWLDNRRSLQSLAPMIYASASLAATLDGELDEAATMRERGQACAANLDRHWFVADSFLLARKHEWAALLDKLERNWDAIEGTVSGVGIRELQMLEALALSRLAERDDNYRGHYSGREIGPLLHGIRRGRFDHLARHWPELREFMQAHGLWAS